ADQSLARQRGGLGLGLALVKGLVELHGGSVSAHSPGLGKGSEFTFRLPLAKEPCELPPRPAEPAAAPVTRPLRILIIEDSVDTARSLQVLLKRSGHEVVLAHSGPAGVEAARKAVPEVVLCDLGLPELDGYGVATALRADPVTA